MKKTMVSILLFVIILNSCSKDSPIIIEETEKEEPDIVTSIISDLWFASTSESKTITFSTNKKWEASISNRQDESWCTISPTNGNAGKINITITTSENTDYDERRATISIKTGNTINKVIIVQRQKNAIIVSKNVFDLSDKGGIYEVEVNTNLELKVSIPENVNWVHNQTSSTRALTEKKLIFKVDENTSYDDRECLITVTDKDNKLSETIKFTQKQKNVLIISNNKFDFNEKGGTFEVGINTNVELKVSIPENINWVHNQTSSTRALTEKKLLFKVDENTTYDERECVINISDNDSKVSDAITIKQEGSKAATVNVEIPGTLGDKLSGFSNKINQLTITGNINSNDLKVIKDMWRIGYLNIYDATITDRGNSITEGMFNPFIGTLILPKTTTRILDKAFYNILDSSLQSLTIPEGVIFIGNEAFSGCKILSTVNMPKSVKTIGEKAFFNCHSLASITLPDNVTTIGASAFSTCVSLSSINIPEGLYNIPYEVFENCIKLKSINIPNSVKVIEEYAFIGSGLTTITIPESVIHIGDAAFLSCSDLKSIHVSSGNSNFTDINGVLTNKDKTVLVAFPNGLTSNYTIPESIKTIKDKAFAGCNSLSSINIPNSVTSIGEAAFSGCISLSSITLPSSIKNITYYTFEGCKALSSITIPNSIEAIQETAFKGCESIQEIHLKRNTPPTGNGGLVYKNTIKLYIPIGSKIAYQNSYYWSNFYEYNEIY